MRPVACFCDRNGNVNGCSLVTVTLRAGINRHLLPAGVFAGHKNFHPEIVPRSRFSFVLIGGFSVRDLPEELHILVKNAPQVARDSFINDFSCIRADARICIVCGNVCYHIHGVIVICDFRPSVITPPEPSGIIKLAARPVRYRAGQKTAVDAGCFAFYIRHIGRRIVRAVPRRALV